MTLPFENDTKEGLKKLSNSSLKHGKMRNIFIIITIILSVSLLTVISLFSLGQKEAMLRQFEVTMHAIYKNITLEQSEGLRTDPQVSDFFIMERGILSEMDDYIIIPIYVEQIKSNIKTSTIVEGKYPTAIDEVMVDKSYIKKIGRKVNLGDTLTFKFWDGSSETFKVSGFTDTGSTGKNYSLWLSESYVKSGSQMKEKQRVGVVRIADASKMSKTDFHNTVISLASKYKIDRGSVAENDRFVNSLSKNIEGILMVIAVGVFILIVSVIVIYSIFYIFVTERICQFGQFRTIGATSKQIRKMVRREGRILCCIGAPIGLLIGSIVAFFLVPKGWNWINTVPTLVIIFIADYITVQLSISNPAKIAGSVSPIEASKISGYEQCICNYSKKLRRKITSFSFAKMNLNRSKKKTRMTVISLGIGGIVFMVAATFIASVNIEDQVRQGDFYSSEYNVYFSSNAVQARKHGTVDIQRNNPINDTLISKINAINGVKKVYTIQKFMVDYEYNGYQSHSSFRGISPKETQALDSFLKEGTVDYDLLTQNKGVVIYQNDMAEKLLGWSFKVGDKVTIRWYDGEVEHKDDFTIMGILVNGKKIQKNYDAFMATRGSDWFMVTEETLKSILPEGFNSNYALMISTDWKAKRDIVDKEIFALMDEQPLLILDTFADAIKVSTGGFNIISSIMLGLCGFIILFSLVNLVNTIVTSVSSRKHEFAMLQSIGMTNGQLIKMVQAEGLILAVWNIALTAIIGSVLSFAIVYLAKEYAFISFLHWHFPTTYFLGYAVVIFVVPVIISAVAIRIFKSKSVVERLRETE